MRLRTLEQAHAELLAADPSCALARTAVPVQHPPVWENGFQIAKFDGPRIFISEGR